MKNMDIRLYARGNGVQHWRLARALGVSEPTLTRWLRDELTEEKKKEYRALIDELAEEMREVRS